VLQRPWTLRFDPSGTGVLWTELFFEMHLNLGYRQLAMENRKTEEVPRFKKIDHIAIAVKDLDEAINFYENVLGFQLVRRLKITGRSTGMISAEMEYNQIKFVLCQGTEAGSQVSKLIDNYGPGVAHIAIAVEDAKATMAELKTRGLEFDTTLIEGAGLKQVFSGRDKNSGISFEFIERDGQEGFLQSNVNELFAQLEDSGAY